jgi:tetratricopeptide (TPR) repeat protein
MNSQALSTLAGQLRQQAQLYIDGQQLESAQTTLESLLQLTPYDSAACIELADVMFMRGHVRASSDPLFQAMRRLPKDAPLLIKLASRLLARGETLGARECLDFLSLAPDPPPELLAAQADLRFALGEVPAARRLMEGAIAAGIDSPDEHYRYAMYLQFSGNIEQACKVLRMCLQRWPHFSGAAMTLANLRRQKPDSNLLGFVQQQLGQLPQDSKNADQMFVRAELEHARFKVLDDLGYYDRAWSALTRRNALMHELHPYDATGEAALTDALIGMAVANGTAKPTPVPEGPTPIFIVGMPRTGTTLLDRMLSNHSAVISAGELIDFWRQLHWVADVVPARTEGLLKVIQRSPHMDFGEVGARYLKQTQWRAQGRRFYIDKLPANRQVVAFIRRALPHAPILRMVREPMDTCFSNFKAMLGNIAPYSYDLQALAHYYRQYERLVCHWQASLPDAMLDVSYASLVCDPETTLRQVLQHCGLVFEAGCLQPELNPSPVTTLSSAQVRESIHTRGVDQWRHYARQLEPLRLAIVAGAAPHRE